MNRIRMFTIGVEYDEDHPEDVIAVDALAVEFEECIGKVGLGLDDLEEEDIS